jgi:flagellar motor component MotA
LIIKGGSRLEESKILKQHTAQQRELLDDAYRCMDMNESPAIFRVDNKIRNYLASIGYTYNGKNVGFGNILASMRKPFIRGHRKEMFDQEQGKKILRMAKDGYSQREIARTMRTSHTTVARYLKKFGEG